MTAVAAKVVAGGAAIYLLALAALYVFQRAFIYVPDRQRADPDRSGVPEMAPVTLRTGDGLDLVAWWRAPRTAEAPVVVYFHGNAGNIGTRGFKVRPYLDRGWGVLLTTWRGYSGNPGRPTEAGLYADGRAALDFIAAQAIAPARVVLYGESLGAAVAVELATGFAAGALVLEAPFTALADVGARQFPIFPVRRLARDRFDSLSKIARVGMPLLVAHGERDRVVPVDQGRRLLDAARAPKQGRFAAAAGHADLYDFGVAADIIAFIEAHVRGAGAGAETKDGPRPKF